jgi:long-chain acyl-CoA synthetase
MAGNVARRFEQAARRDAPKQVVLPADGGPGFDYATLDRRAGAVAAMLAARSIGPGKRIALSLDAPADVVVAVLGGLKAGAAVAPLNPRLSAEERRRILDDLAPAMVLDALPADGADRPAVPVADTDGAIVLYTSGSTGRPKGVLLSHAAVAAGLDIWIDGVMALARDDVMLSALPLAHSFGLFGTVLSPLQVGAAIVLVPRFTPEAAIAAIARWRPTVFPGVATMFRRVLDCQALTGADVTSLRIAVSGAAPCPWTLAEEWQAKTGVRIVRGYGMSELFRPVSFSALDGVEMPDSIGRALPGVRLRIVDETAGDVRVGEIGELWIHTPACLTEYLNQAEETRAVLEDGWFKTGDLATLSADGLVRIVGRKKEIILRGGYTVAAGEVEAVLTSHPEIAEAAVIGVPDDELGEEIRAYVVLRPTAQAAPDDIIGWCKARVAAYKYPRQIRLCDELPRGPTGKVDKSRLPA